MGNETANQGKENREAGKPGGPLTLFQETLYANLMFWGFLACAAVLGFFLCGSVWDDVTEGVMEFLFFILGGGFTLVSVIDYFYEKNASQGKAGMKKA